MKKGQQADAPNAAIARPFHVECQWRGVGDPFRWADKELLMDSKLRVESDD